MEIAELDKTPHIAAASIAVHTNKQKIDGEIAEVKNSMKEKNTHKEHKTQQNCLFQLITKNGNDVITFHVSKKFDEI